MHCQITNNSALDISGFRDIIQSLVSFSKERYGFKRPPALFLNSDPENATDPLGKTAYYDPESQEIHIYVDNRHPKDIMRSIAHELIHHVQNMRGDFDGNHYHGPGYAQKDKHMRNMEKEAYLEGNLLLRDFEDIKQENKTIYNEWRTNTMSLNEWKNNELFTLLSNKWGFGKKVVTENNDKEITHMCALKVTHKGSGQVGHPYKHTLTESGDISHYSVEFDDVLVENIAVEDLDIMVQKEHMHAKNDEKDHAKDKPVVSEEELEEMHCPSGKKDDEMNEDPNRPDAALKKYLKSRGVSDEELAKMSAKDMDRKAAMLRFRGGEDDVALEEDLEEQNDFVLTEVSLKDHQKAVQASDDYRNLPAGSEVKQLLNMYLKLTAVQDPDPSVADSRSFFQMLRNRGDDVSDKVKAIISKHNPYMDEEKKLSDDEIAALEPPKDEITQADILKMRGAELDEMHCPSGKKEEDMNEGMKAAKNEQLKESMRKRFARLIK